MHSVARVTTMAKQTFQSLRSSPSAEKPVKSPCISVCVLNPDNVCTGCYRSGQEISYWGRYSNEEKEAVLARARERARAMNPFLD